MKPKDNASSPYAGCRERLILRDVLAIDRTRLANERTLLTWMRTALMLLVSGITLLKLFAEVLAMEILGASLIPAALVIAVAGLKRYLQVRGRIQAVDAD